MSTCRFASIETKVKVEIESIDVIREQMYSMTTGYLLHDFLFDECTIVTSLVSSMMFPSIRKRSNKKRKNDELFIVFNIIEKNRFNEVIFDAFPLFCCLSKETHLQLNREIFFFIFVFVVRLSSTDKSILSKKLFRHWLHARRMHKK